MNKHKSNKIKENSYYSEALDNGTDHNHSKSCCDQSSPARRTTISSANWPLECETRGTYKWTRNHTYWGLKNNWGMQSKNGLQNLWGNKKIISLYNPIKFMAILYPTSLVNMVVEVGSRCRHQILLAVVVNFCVIG